MDTPDAHTPPAWSLEQLSQQSGIPARTLRRWCRLGWVTALRVGRSYRIPDGVARAVISGDPGLMGRGPLDDRPSGNDTADP